VNAPLMADEAETATAFMTALHATFLERSCRTILSPACTSIVPIQTRSDAPRSSKSRTIER
jgi:hypothetical protein